MRTCKKCQRELPLENFYFISKGKGKDKRWRKHTCKECICKSSKEQYYKKKGENKRGGK